MHEDAFGGIRSLVLGLTAVGSSQVPIGNSFILRPPLKSRRGDCREVRAANVSVTAPQVHSGIGSWRQDGGKAPPVLRCAFPARRAREPLARGTSAHARRAGSSQRRELRALSPFAAACSSGGLQQEWSRWTIWTCCCWKRTAERRPCRGWRCELAGERRARGASAGEPV